MSEKYYEIYYVRPIGSKGFISEKYYEIYYVRPIGSKYWIDGKAISDKSKQRRLD